MIPDKFSLHIRALINTFNSLTFMAAIIFYISWGQAHGKDDSEKFEEFLRKSKLSPLDKAILSHNLDEVRNLIEGKTFSVNSKETKNGFPLMYAVIANSPDIVEYLLEKGANIEAEMENGITPLAMAVYWNLTEVAKILIHHKADVNKKIKGAYLIDMAEQSLLIEMKKILADAGAKGGIGPDPVNKNNDSKSSILSSSPSSSPATESGTTKVKGAGRNSEPSTIRPIEKK